MKRSSTFRPKVPPRAARDRSDEFASVVLPRPTAVMATAQSIAGAPVRTEAAKLPRQARTIQSLRDSANGRACLLRFPGCPCDGTMAIWSHCRHHYAGKGGSIKSHDLLGALACTYCDAIYDGNRPRPDGLSIIDVELAWWRAHAESIVIYARDGVLGIGAAQPGAVASR